MLKPMIQTVTSSNDGLRYILILLPYPHLYAVFKKELEWIFSFPSIWNAPECSGTVRWQISGSKYTLYVTFHHFAWRTFPHAEGEEWVGRTRERRSVEYGSQLRLNPCKMLLPTTHALLIAKDNSRNRNLERLSADVNISECWLNVYAILLKV
jgi:hypothetical protein